MAHCLDGLEELCAFMEPRPQSNGSAVRNNGRAFSPSSYMSPPVERAYAADELENGQFQSTPRGSEYTSTPKTAMAGTIAVSRTNGSKSMSEQEVKSEFVRTLRDGQSTSLKETGTFVVEEENATESQTMLMTASILNDLNQSSSTGNSSSNGGGSFTSSYEYPEHRIPRMAQKVIGDRREVELVVMARSQPDEEHSSLGSDCVPSRNPQGERRDSN